MRTPFAVGRLDRQTRQVTWVRARSQTRPAAPFPGPWSLEARVRAVEEVTISDPPGPDAPEPPHPAEPPKSRPATDVPPALPSDGEQLRLL